LNLSYEKQEQDRLAGTCKNSSDNAETGVAAVKLRNTGVAAVKLRNTGVAAVKQRNIGEADAKKLEYWRVERQKSNSWNTAALENDSWDTWEAAVNHQEYKISRSLEDGILKQNQPSSWNTGELAA
jgi:hypothetical protein